MSARHPRPNELPVQRTPGPPQVFVVTITEYNCYCACGFNTVFYEPAPMGGLEWQCFNCGQEWETKGGVPIPKT